MSRCFACNSEVVWVEAPSGQKMMVNAHTAKAGDTQYEAGRHQPHIVTCPDPLKHRQKKP